MKIAIIGAGHLGNLLATVAEKHEHTVMRLGKGDSKSYLDIDLAVITTPPKNTIFCLEEEIDLNDGVPIISFVAGISLASYSPHTTAGAVKAMTNIAAGDGKGFTVWAKDREIAPRPMSRIYAFMNMLGPSERVEDSNFHRSDVHTKTADAYLDDATALIGSGTAYAVGLLENFVQYGIEEGLTRDMAERWVHQTFLSAIHLCKQQPASEIIKSIATPNGTTAAGLEWLSSDKVGLSIFNALSVTGEKCRELSGNGNY